MPINTCGTAEELMRRVEDPERITWENMAGTSTAATVEDADEVCLVGREGHTLESFSSIT